MAYLKDLASFEYKRLIRNRLICLLAVLAIVAILFPSTEILLLQLLVIQSVTEDRRKGVNFLLNSYSYKAWQLIAIRVAVLFLFLLCLWPCMVIVISLWPLGPEFFLQHTMALALLTFQYAIMAFCAIGFVFFMSSLCGGRSGWLYLLAIFYWVIGTVLADNLSYLPYSIRFALWGFGLMLPTAPSALSFFFTDWQLIFSLAVTQIAAAFLSLWLVILAAMLRRQESIRQERIWGWFFLVICCMALYGSFETRAAIERSEAAFRQAVAVAATEVTAEEQAVLQLESYDLALNLDTKAGYLAATATIHGRMGMTAQELVFTLRPYLTVQTVQTSDGRDLPWQRQGAYLFIEVPPAVKGTGELTLSIVYGGRVDESFNDRLAQPRGVINRISSDFSLLRSAYAWYPIPGQQVLYKQGTYENPWTKQQEVTLWAQPAFHEAVPFQLTVTMDCSDLTIATNLPLVGQETKTAANQTCYRFYSPKGRNLFVIAGPYVRSEAEIPGQAKPVTVYTFSWDQMRKNEALQELAEPSWFYDSWIAKGGDGAALPSTIIEVPQSFGSNSAGQPIKGLTLYQTTVIGENDYGVYKPFQFLREIQKNKYTIAALQHWWQNDMTAESSQWRGGSIPEAVMAYLYNLHQEKTYPKGTRDDFVEPFLLSGPVANNVFMILDAVQTKDSRAFKAFIQELYVVYDQTGTLSEAQFSTALAKTTAQVSWSPEEKLTLTRCQQTLAAQLDNQDQVKKQAPFSLSFFAFRMEDWLP
ncbi:MAG: hypothetical protein E6713_05440 [Sporomusaceae bacterium]|nr:hypothetical protein [Sporomusaceae bacterium]